jgi:hypothetical protein
MPSFAIRQDDVENPRTAKIIVVRERALVIDYVRRQDPTGDRIYRGRDLSGTDAL